MDMSDERAVRHFHNGHTSEYLGPSVLSTPKFDTSVLAPKKNKQGDSLNEWSSSGFAGSEVISTMPQDGNRDAFIALGFLMLQTHQVGVGIRRIGVALEWRSRWW
jgi:hypothetical protein